MKPYETDYKRLALALFLCTGLLVFWQYKVELPRRQHMTQVAKQAVKQKQVEKQAVATAIAEEGTLTREQRLVQDARIRITSGTLRGSISLKGLRFDDLQLEKYRTTLDLKSPEVTLLNPNGQQDAYFAHVGWLATDASVKLPDDQTVWQADGKELTPEKPVMLSWENGQGLRFTVEISLDANYLFSIRQKVHSQMAAAVTLQPYAYINRAYADAGEHNYIMHEGPLGVLNGALSEIAYQKLRDEGVQSFASTSGWLGITDKYWLTAMIPDQANPFSAKISHYKSHERDRYQVDYTGAETTLAQGENSATILRLFAGAKEIGVLDRYTKGDASIGLAPVPLFDRSVDFGSLYFLTKPMFLLLNIFYTHIGNFGLAILMLTIVVKLMMYPLANKSYMSTSQMRALQPEMEKVRAQCGDDRAQLNQEIMALYKREKVNPAAGCLPVLVQMPVFFALYKVLFVTIEMRHAPFFGWIHDLSVADPSNIFTLLGLLEWNAPGFMHIGILPLLMCASMVIQMKQQPKPTDPTQAKVMAWMPYFMLLIFAPMPAGLVLYWTWSNMLSILQQYVITRRFKARQQRTLAKVRA